MCTVVFFFFSSLPVSITFPYLLVPAPSLIFLFLCFPLSPYSCSIPYSPSSCFKFSPCSLLHLFPLLLLLHIYCTCSFSVFSPLFLLHLISLFLLPLISLLLILLISLFLLLFFASAPSYLIVFLLIVPALISFLLLLPLSPCSYPFLDPLLSVLFLSFPPYLLFLNISSISSLYPFFPLSVVHFFYN